MTLKSVNRLLALFLAVGLPLTSVPRTSYLVSRTPLPSTTRSEMRFTGDVSFGVEAVIPPVIAAFRNGRQTAMLDRAAPSGSRPPALGSSLSRLTQPHETLQHYPLFSGMGPADIQNILKAARPTKFKDQDTLFRQGESVDRIYLVTSGWVKSTLVSEKGVDVILKWSGTGEILGAEDLAFNSAKKHLYNAQPSKFVETVFWDHKIFMKLCENYPLLRKNLDGLMYRDLDELRERIRRITFDRAPVRLAFQLTMMSKHYQANDGVVAVPLWREDIAQMTGLTVYTVSRTLAKWSDAGYVHTARGTVTIFNPETFLRTIEDEAYVSNPPSTGGKWKTADLLGNAGLSASVMRSLRPFNPSFGELATVPLLTGILPKDQKRIVESARTLELGDAQPLFSQGNTATYVFLLTSGQVKLYNPLHYGNALFSLIGAGSLLGGADAVFNSAHTYMITGQTLRFARMAVWSRNAFEGLCLEYPQLRANLENLTYEQLKALSHRYLEMATEDVSHRMAFQLLRTVRHLAGSDSWDRKIHLDKGEIANIVGTTEFTVSRTLRKWVKMGFIVSGRGYMTFKRCGLLLEWLNSSPPSFDARGHKETRHAA
jgi:CRP-like cAMP-binding protein